MANPPILHHRKSIRLKGYDYSQAGLYFITIIVQNRVCLFGHIGGASVGANNDSPLPAPQMILNDAGHIANQCWLDIPKHFPNVVLHEFIIMPNHVHGIIELVGVGANNDSPQPNNESPQPNHQLPQPNNDSSLSNNESSRINHQLPLPADHYSPMNTRSIVGANDDSPMNMRSLVGANGDSPMNMRSLVGANGDSPMNMRSIVGANGDSPMNMRSLVGANGDSPLRSPSKTIGSIVRGYKIGVTKWFRSTGHMGKIWQRNYWEHIIRDEKSYCRISEYIKNNPQNWKKGHTILRGK